MRSRFLWQTEIEGNPTQGGDRVIILLITTAGSNDLAISAFDGGIITWIIFQKNLPPKGTERGQP